MASAYGDDSPRSVSPKKKKKKQRDGSRDSFSSEGDRSVISVSSHASRMSVSSRPSRSRTTGQQGLLRSSMMQNGPAAPGGGASGRFIGKQSYVACSYAAMQLPNDALVVAQRSDPYGLGMVSLQSPLTGWADVRPSRPSIAKPPPRPGDWVDKEENNAAIPFAMNKPTVGPKVEQRRPLSSLRRLRDVAKEDVGRSSSPGRVADAPEDHLLMATGERLAAEAIGVSASTTSSSVFSSSDFSVQNVLQKTGSQWCSKSLMSNAEILAALIVRDAAREDSSGRRNSTERKATNPTARGTSGNAMAREASQGSPGSPRKSVPETPTNGYIDRSMFGKESEAPNQFGPDLDPFDSKAEWVEVVFGQVMLIGSFVINWGRHFAEKYMLLIPAESGDGESVQRMPYWLEPVKPPAYTLPFENTDGKWSVAHEEQSGRGGTEVIRFLGGPICCGRIRLRMTKPGNTAGPGCKLSDCFYSISGLGIIPFHAQGLGLGLRAEYFPSPPDTTISKNIIHTKPQTCRLEPVRMPKRPNAVEQSVSEGIRSGSKTDAEIVRDDPDSPSERADVAASRRISGSKDGPISPLRHLGPSPGGRVRHTPPYNEPKKRGSAFNIVSLKAVGKFRKTVRGDPMEVYHGQSRKAPSRQVSHAPERQVSEMPERIRTSDNVRIPSKDSSQSKESESERNQSKDATESSNAQPAMNFASFSGWLQIQSGGDYELYLSWISPAGQTSGLPDEHLEPQPILKKEDEPVIVGGGVPRTKNVFLQIPTDTQKLLGQIATRATGGMQQTASYSRGISGIPTSYNKRAQTPFNRGTTGMQRMLSPDGCSSADGKTNSELAPEDEDTGYLNCFLWINLQPVVPAGAEEGESHGQLQKNGSDITFKRKLHAGCHALVIEVEVDLPLNAYHHGIPALTLSYRGPDTGGVITAVPHSCLAPPLTADCSLASVRVHPGMKRGLMGFDPSCREHYVPLLPYEIAEVTLSATPARPSGRVYILGEDDLGEIEDDRNRILPGSESRPISLKPGGTTQVYVRCVAQDLCTRSTYALHLTRDSWMNCTLSQLSIATPSSVGGEWYRTYDIPPDGHGDTIMIPQLPYMALTATITAHSRNPHVFIYIAKGPSKHRLEEAANLGRSGDQHRPIQLHVGRNVVYVRVISPDRNLKAWNWTIVINRHASSDAALKAIFIEPIGFHKFLPSSDSYDVPNPVDSGVSEILVSVEANHNDAKLYVGANDPRRCVIKRGQHRYDYRNQSLGMRLPVRVGRNTIYVRVVAMDNTTSKTYAFQCIRRPIPLVEGFKLLGGNVTLAANYGKTTDWTKEANVPGFRAKSKETKLHMVTKLLVETGSRIPSKSKEIRKPSKIIAPAEATDKIVDALPRPWWTLSKVDVALAGAHARANAEAEVERQDSPMSAGSSTVKTRPLSAYRAKTRPMSAGTELNRPASAQPWRQLNRPASAQSFRLSSNGAEWHSSGSGAVSINRRLPSKSGQICDDSYLDQDFAGNDMPTLTVELDAPIMCAGLRVHWKAHAGKRTNFLVFVRGQTTQELVRMPRDKLPNIIPTFQGDRAGALGMKIGFHQPSRPSVPVSTKTQVTKSGWRVEHRSEAVNEVTDDQDNTDVTNPRDFWRPCVKGRGSDPVVLPEPLCIEAFQIQLMAPFALKDLVVEHIEVVPLCINALKRQIGYGFVAEFFFDDPHGMSNGGQPEITALEPSLDGADADSLTMRVPAQRADSPWTAQYVGVLDVREHGLYTFWLETKTFRNDQTLLWRISVDGKVLLPKIEDPKAKKHSKRSRRLKAKRKRDTIKEGSEADDDNLSDSSVCSRAQGQGPTSLGEPVTPVTAGRRTSMSFEKRPSGLSYGLLQGLTSARVAQQPDGRLKRQVSEDDDDDSVCSRMSMMSQSVTGSHVPRRSSVNGPCSKSKKSKVDPRKNRWITANCLSAMSDHANIPQGMEVMLQVGGHHVRIEVYTACHNNDSASFEDFNEESPRSSLSMGSDWLKPASVEDWQKPKTGDGPADNDMTVKMNFSYRGPDTNGHVIVVPTTNIAPPPSNSKNVGDLYDMLLPMAPVLARTEIMESWAEAASSITSWLEEEIFLEQLHGLSLHSIEQEDNYLGACQVAVIHNRTLHGGVDLRGLRYREWEYNTACVPRDILQKISVFLSKKKRRFVALASAADAVYDASHMKQMLPNMLVVWYLDFCDDGRALAATETIEGGRRMSAAEALRATSKDMPTTSREYGNASRSASDKRTKNKARRISNEGSDESSSSAPPSPSALPGCGDADPALTRGGMRRGSLTLEPFKITAIQEQDVAADEDASPLGLREARSQSKKVYATEERNGPERGAVPVFFKTGVCDDAHEVIDQVTLHMRDEGLRRGDLLGFTVHPVRVPGTAKCRTDCSEQLEWVMFYITAPMGHPRIVAAGGGTPLSSVQGTLLQTQHSWKWHINRLSSGDLTAQSLIAYTSTCIYKDGHNECLQLVLWQDPGSIDAGSSEGLTESSSSSSSSSASSEGLSQGSSVCSSSAVKEKDSFAAEEDVASRVSTIALVRQRSMSDPGSCASLVRPDSGGIEFTRLRSGTDCSERCSERRSSIDALPQFDWDIPDHLRSFKRKTDRSVDAGAFEIFFCYDFDDEAKQLSEDADENMLDPFSHLGRRRASVDAMIQKLLDDDAQRNTKQNTLEDEEAEVPHTSASGSAGSAVKALRSSQEAVQLLQNSIYPAVLLQVDQAQSRNAAASLLCSWTYPAALERIERRKRKENKRMALDLLWNSTYPAGVLKSSKRSAGGRDAEYAECERERENEALHPDEGTRASP